MLFVFSWPATTLSSGTLWGGIEYQCESRGSLTDTLEKLWYFSQEIPAGAELTTMLRS